MKFIINDAEKELDYVTETIIGGRKTEDTGVLKTFIDEAELKNPEYKLYAYAFVSDGKLFIKFGEAIEETVFDRYNHTGADANKHMIAVWKATCGDTVIHNKLKEREKNNRGYKHVAKVDSINNTKESYEVSSKVGLDNLLADITEYANSNIVTAKTHRADFPDIISIVDEIRASGKKYVFADLCPRWGKTGTDLLLAKRYAWEDNERIFVIAAYVGTVKHSYAEEIIKYSNNDFAKFIDPDAYESIEECYNDMRSWLDADSKNYIVYYLALTGDEDTCFARRLINLTNFPDETMNLLIEEADFGSACKKQVDKIKKLLK